ncbi:hypothetical protein TKK_0004176 [Trichogramma kaykai]
MIATKLPEVQHRECCQTHVKVNDCKFNWTIYNFSFFKEKPGEPLESTIFSPTNDPGLQWRIVLYPSGNHHEYKDYLSLFLHLVSCDKPSVVVDFRFCVVDKHGRDINEHKPSRKWVFYQNRMSGHPKFLRRDYVLNPANNLLVADRLRLKCFIRSADGTFEHTNYDCNVPQVPDLTKQLAEDYGKLLESERCSDVVLVARDGAKLQAHKVVLAARSPVFAAMFEHEMRESRENEVQLRDWDAELIKQLLEYIYTGRVPCFKGKTVPLLMAAEQYALEGLKTACEYELCVNMSVEDAVELLLMADMHNAQNLKQAALNYVKTNIREIIDTPSFRQLTDVKPYLMADILKALV